MGMGMARDRCGFQSDGENLLRGVLCRGGLLEGEDGGGRRHFFRWIQKLGVSSLLLYMWTIYIYVRVKVAKCISKTTQYGILRHVPIAADCAIRRVGGGDDLHGHSV